MTHTLEANPCYSNELSEMTCVQVTHLGEVNFIIKPDLEYLPHTVVNFTKPNWINLMTVAKPKIDWAIREKQPLNLNYHSTSKTVRVFHWQNNKYQVHLLTFAVNGALRIHQSVFLMQEEYEKFEECLHDINQAVDNVTPETQKTMLTGYRWRVVPKDERDAAKMPQCPMPFYLQGEAQSAGQLEFFKDGSNLILKSEVYEEFMSIPDEMNFFKKVYLSTLLRACELLALIVEEEPVVGAQASRHFLPMVREMITEDLIKQLYLNAWKELDLPFTNADILLKNLRNVLELDSTDDLLKVALRRLSNIETDPDLTYIAGVIRRFDYPNSISMYDYIEELNRTRVLKKMGKSHNNSQTNPDYDEELEDVRVFCMREKLLSTRSEASKRKLPRFEPEQKSKNPKTCEEDDCAKDLPLPTLPFSPPLPVQEEEGQPIPIVTLTSPPITFPNGFDDYDV